MSKYLLFYLDLNKFFCFFSSFRQDTQSSQQQTRGVSYENSRYQNNNNGQGNNDNAYAGGYNRGGVPSSQQQSSTQVYRPPHMQNRMNMQK